MNELELDMPSGSEAPAPDRSIGAARWRRPDATTAWALLLAAVSVVALLATMVAVVQRGVQDAALRHAETASRADASWRCNAVADAQQRRECRQRADGPRLHGTAPLR